MIIYLLSVVWFLMCEIMFRKRQEVLNGDIKEYHVTRMHAFVAVAFLIFFIGLRSAGADTEAYIIMFNRLRAGIGNIIDSFKEEEGIFRAFGVIIKTFISANYHFYLFIIALLSGFFIADTFRRETQYFTSAMVLFVLSGTYTWMINGIRQFIAVVLAFAAIDFIVEKKTLRYIILIVLLSGIHTSALIMIPVYFLVTGKPFASKTLIMLAIAIFAVFYTERFLNYFGFALQDTVYEGIMEGEIWKNDNGSNVLRTVIYAVPVVLAWIERRNIRENAPPVIYVCVNMSIICVCFSIIANVTSGVLVGRIPIYFSLYSLILLPWLANNMKNKKYEMPLRISMYLFYLIYFFVNGTIYYYSDLLFGGRIIQ